ncbi:CPBP family intramembrane glutamic endopeptidase [Robertmurraya siralis]|uniref:CPBP family intramembrane glutamic endopeptidase n=2 Tax=Robertmurraya TaxID=2837507 RepID=UPI0010F65921|nr:CPBP family intramembrane glutamic endopeptidase [Robertmurraya siralis]
MKIVGLELLLILFFTVNGAFVTITMPTSPALQFIGLLPLAVGTYIYLVIKGKWNNYFSVKKLKPIKKTFLFGVPLLLVLLLVFIGNKGINTSSLLDVFLIFMIQLFVVAFIEEIFFRGFMLNTLLSKGYKKAVMISSSLFAITHSLQLLGGQSLEDTLLQIIYAFVVGMVLSLLIINNQSIIMAIAFHGLNNSLQLMGQDQGSSIFSYVIIAILITYSIFLWMRASNATILK